MKWGSILYASPVLHYSFAFLAGIGIKLMLDKFYISHAKRSIGFSWRYPPVTISVLFGLLFIVGYVYFTYSNEIVEQLTAHAFVSFKFLSLSFLAVAATIIYQTKLYTKNPIFSVVLCAVSAFYLFAAINLVEIAHAFWVFFFIAIAYLGMSVYLLWEQLKASRVELIVESKQEAELMLESLKDFQRWFKDDSIIKNKEELEQDLKVYANRITERLRSGGDHEEGIAQHIALCGPYGCGKSSIVAAIANELKRPKKIEVELPDEEKLKVEQQNSINWIHSDISTWGAASGSVAHVILSNIIDDISQRIDMCAFRALPKHYTEALKSGGSFFQFASTLLAGPVDIEESFKKLNDVLEVTNHKLLITLQDVDRGTGDENEKRLNDIAALLDRLKDRKLSHINFIIAMGNTKIEHIEVLSKIADHVETIVEQDFRDKLCKWAELSTKEIFNKEMVLTNEPFIINFNRYTKLTSDIFSEERYLPGIIASNLIISMRMLKRIMRRVDKCWVNEKLLGEVAFDSLMLLMTLRELKPVLFNQFISNYPRLLNGTSSHINPVEGSRSIKEMLHDLVTNNSCPIENKVLTSLIECSVDLPDHLMEAKGNFAKKDGRDYLQGIGNSQDTVNYLNRILLEAVPKNELRDQEVLKYFKTVSPENAAELANHICTDHRWLVSFKRFNGIFGVGDGIEDKNKRKSLAFAILDNKQAEKSGVFSPPSTFEDTLLRTVVIEGHLEEVLNKLAGIEPAQSLLFRILFWHYNHLFIGHELPELRISIDSKGDYFDVEKSEDRRKIAEKAKSFTQGMDFRSFLIENLDQLNMKSIDLITEYWVFTQFSDSKFNFNEQRIKNIFEVCKNSSPQRAIIILIDLSMTPRTEELKLLIKLINSEGENFKFDLKSRIERADVNNESRIKDAIGNLGL